MDFLDPSKRRGYNIRLFVGFVLISIAIVLGTIILTLITAGYNIDRKTGQIIQNGLVFINSQPTAATIYINGINRGTTNARLEMPAGNYSVTLQEPGYRSWSNTFTLYGGDVDQLDYPFLFVNNSVKTTINSFTSQPMIASSTPDRHWMLISVPGQLGNFYLIDLTNTKTPITTVAIPSNILGSQPGNNVLSAVQWSTDNIHLLIKDSYQGGVQYIMFDRSNPAASINVSQLFSSTPFSEIRLDNNAFDKLYLYNQPTGSLVLADLTTAKTTSILQGVLAFWPYSTDQILYTTADSKNANLVDANLWTASVNKSYTLRTLPVGSSYQLNMASYNGHTYVVMGSSSSGFAYVYMDPLSQLASNPGQLPLPDTLLVINGTPENVTFSDSARFIALQSSSQFAVYDLQQDAHYRYNTNLSFSPGQLAVWMDGNRLDAVIGGKLTIWDFDGTNTVSFVNATTDFLPAFNTGYDGVYTLTPTPNSTTGGWQLIRNSLIVNKP